MTDKDTKDYCKNCDVEPPAMRFKCPEIAELAKKSIRLTEENRWLEEALDEIEEYCNITGDLPFRTTASDILNIINKSIFKNRKKYKKKQI